jgi:hypothetical protein
MVLNPQKKDFLTSLRAGPETVEELRAFHQKFCVLIDLKKNKTKDKFINTSVANAFSVNTDGIFNRFVTVFANRARHVSGELSLGRETEAI